MRSLDVKSVRDRFRHLHTAASMGGTSQQSMQTASSIPSRASIEAASAAKSLGPSTPDRVASAEVQPARSAAQQGTPKQATAVPGALQLPAPHEATVTEASILQDFAQHRKAQRGTAALSSELDAAPKAGNSHVAQNGSAKAPKQVAGLHAGQAASAAADNESTGQDAGKGGASAGQRQIYVCSSRVCGLQARFRTHFCTHSTETFTLMRISVTTDTTPLVLPSHLSCHAELDFPRRLLRHQHTLTSSVRADTLLACRWGHRRYRRLFRSGSLRRWESSAGWCSSRQAAAAQWTGGCS